MTDPAFQFLQRFNREDFVSVIRDLRQRLSRLESRTKEPLGWITEPALPASNVTVTNTYGRHATVYINGGTVSAINVGGIATGRTTGAVRVNAEDSISVTYSAAPTWKWYLD